MELARNYQVAANPGALKRRAYQRCGRRHRFVHLRICSSRTWPVDRYARAVSVPSICVLRSLIKPETSKRDRTAGWIAPSQIGLHGAGSFVEDTARLARQRFARPLPATNQNAARAAAERIAAVKAAPPRTFG
jgi:hypothetical protein